MGATWMIENNSNAEFEALRSEGAPTVHMTYTSCMHVMRAAGIEVDGETYVFIIPADAVADAAVRLREAAWADANVGWRGESVAEVCDAAARLGRGVYAA